MWKCSRRPPIWTLLRHMTEYVLPGYLIGTRLSVHVSHFIFYYVVTYHVLFQLLGALKIIRWDLCSGEVCECMCEGLYSGMEMIVVLNERRSRWFGVGTMVMLNEGRSRWFGVETRVVLNKGRSRLCGVEKRLRLGYPLSALLFNTWWEGLRGGGGVGRAQLGVNMEGCLCVYLCIQMIC